MKKIILSFLIFTFGLFGFSQAEFKPFTNLDLVDFKKEISSSIVIDIRTPDELLSGTIVEKPLNIDYYSNNFDDELKKLDKNKKYLIYCHSGNRTGSTLKKMKDMGFSSVADLKGGINVWDEKLFGLPDRKEILKDYLGKTTLILIAGTFCPHCKTDVPEVEKKIFNKVGAQINSVINVVDGNDGKRFKTDIPQISNPLLNFKNLVGQECGYVPSWILIDKDGSVINSKCGDSGQDGIISELEKLNISFDKVKTDKEDNDKKDNDIILWIILFIVLAGGYWTFKK